MLNPNKDDIFNGCCFFIAIKRPIRKFFGSTICLSSPGEEIKFRVSIAMFYPLPEVIPQLKRKQILPNYEANQELQIEISVFEK